MRKNHPLQKLRRHFLTKIMASFALTIIVIVGLTNFLILHKEHQALLNNMKIQGERTAAFLAQTSRLGVYTENNSQLQSPVTAILEQYNVLTAAIFSQTGKLLFKQDQGTHPQLPDIETSLDAENPQLPSFSPSATAPITQENNDYFLFWAPITFNTGNFKNEEDLYFEEAPPTPQIEIIGIAAVAISKQGLKRQQNHILLNTIAGSLILSILCVSSLFFILRHFTRPLTKLISEVNTFGITTKTRYDDLGVLTDTYTAMVEALSDSFETIHGMKKDLEVKVVERTKELETTNEALADRQLGLEKSYNLQAETLRELQETQAHLVQSEKMAALGQVVAGVAHEVNNTINFIANALPALQQRIADLQKENTNPQEENTEQYQQNLIEQIKTLIINIDEGTKRTSEIVRDLQDFSRSEAPGLKYFSINEGLESTLAIIHPEYRNRITITKDYGNNIPQITCNPGQINQVFMNILLNAFQAIPDNGTVNIKTRQDDAKVFIYIKDDGPGIAAEIITKIFDPFFTTKDVGQGTGLGLGICYQIINNHHGEIKVHNNKDKGAEFEIILPITPPEPESSDNETPLPHCPDKG